MNDYKNVKQLDYIGQHSPAWSSTDVGHVPWNTLMKKQKDLWNSSANLFQSTSQFRF